MQKNKSINKEGIGLGLYITKNLVEELGGRITVDSQEGVYTRFVATFPEKKTFEISQKKRKLLQKKGVAVTGFFEVEQELEA